MSILDQIGSIFLCDCIGQNLTLLPLLGTKLGVLSCASTGTTFSHHSDISVSFSCTLSRVCLTLLGVGSRLSLVEEVLGLLESRLQIALLLHCFLLLLYELLIGFKLVKLDGVSYK